MNIGDIMRVRRQELGLTLEEVGDYVGVGKSTVRKWEHGDIENMKCYNTIKEPPALYPISCGSWLSDRGLLLYHFAGVGKMLFYCPFYCLDYANMSATIKLKIFLKNF